VAVTAKVEKPPIPTLWLDTSVGVKLAKAGRSELPAAEAAPLLALKELVVRQTLARRLLCVEGEQDEEYGAERLDEETAAEFARMTLGIQLHLSLAIRDKQIFLGMDALVAGLDQVVIPWRDFFLRDPLKELAEISERGWFARVGPPGAPFGKTTREMRHQDATVFEQWRVQNRKNGKTFEEQFRAELASEAERTPRQWTEWQQRTLEGRLTLLDSLAMQGPQMYASHWKKLGGQPEGIEGVASYLRSEHHAAIPANRIPATLWADILTGDERVRTSDPGDVHLLSPALSIAHFILTDVRARRRILRRGLDTEWGAKVYSVRELPELMDAIRLLEKP
jgi:hypothetical protein